MKTALTALAAAFVWGTAFAFQRMAAGKIGAITFNFYRSVLAALSLGGLLCVSKKRNAAAAPENYDRKKALVGGVVCGVLVLAASVVQQYAIADTEAGKAGFLTTLYILLVPLFSVVVLHKKVAPGRWVSVVLGLTGLYFISVKENFTISPSDALILVSAAIYAAYILAADYYVRFCSPTLLNCLQFAVASVVSLIAAVALEQPTLSQLRENIIPILYLGIFSSAIAYTLQFTAQKNGNPVAVTLLLSMESVFSVLGAAVLLHEYLSARELFGCGIMLCAVILVQLPEGFWKRKKKLNAE